MIVTVTAAEGAAREIRLPVHGQGIRSTIRRLSAWMALKARRRLQDIPVAVHEFLVPQGGGLLPA
jgi:hypothetical protein